MYFPKTLNQAGLSENFHLASASQAPYSSIFVMAYVQFYLPLLHWSTKDISAFMSQAMEMLWKTKTVVKALRLMKLDMVCSARMHSGLNILNLRYHVLARKITMLKAFFRKQQPWSFMLATMCSGMQTFAYGHWVIALWEVVIVRFVGKIPGCPFSTVMSRMMWSC